MVVKLSCFRSNHSEHATGEPVSWDPWCPVSTKLGQAPILDAGPCRQQVLVIVVQASVTFTTVTIKDDKPQPI